MCWERARIRSSTKRETRYYFYRDVDDQGEPVPPGLFSVGVDGGGVRPIYLLPERYKFWKEDGDFFVQAPPPDLCTAATNRIMFYAFESLGSRVRFTVGLDGQFLELRRRLTRIAVEMRFGASRPGVSGLYTCLMGRWLPGWLAGVLAAAAVVTMASRRAPASPRCGRRRLPEGNVPPEIVPRHFTPEDVARGRAYTHGRSWLFAAGTLLRLAVLGRSVFTPASAALRNLRRAPRPRPSGAGGGALHRLLSIAFELLTLPLGYYAGFVREHAFRPLHADPGAWLLDRLKGAALACPGGPPGVPARVALASLSGAVGVSRLGIVRPAYLVWRPLAPIVIDPLFHTIRPLLKRGCVSVSLRWRVGQVSRWNRCTSSTPAVGRRRATPISRAWGPPSGSCCTTPLSRIATPTRWSWSSPTKWATGNSHIWQGIGLALGGVGILLWCGATGPGLGRRASGLPSRRACGCGGSAPVSARALRAEPVGLPIQNVISRHFERQADWKSLELTGNPAAFIRAEVDLARANLADLAPSRALVWAALHPSPCGRAYSNGRNVPRHPVSAGPGFGLAIRLELVVCKTPEGLRFGRRVAGGERHEHTLDALCVCWCWGSC